MNCDHPPDRGVWSPGKSRRDSMHCSPRHFRGTRTTRRPRSFSKQCQHGRLSFGKVSISAALLPAGVAFHRPNRRIDQAHQRECRHHLHGHRRAGSGHGRDRAPCCRGFRQCPADLCDHRHGERGGGGDGDCVRIAQERFERSGGAIRVAARCRHWTAAQRRPPSRRSVARAMPQGGPAETRNGKTGAMPEENPGWCRRKLFGEPFGDAVFGSAFAFLRSFRRRA